MTYEEFKILYRISDEIQSDIMELCKLKCDELITSFKDINLEFENFDNLLENLNVSFKDYRYLRWASCSFGYRERYKHNNIEHYGYWRCNTKRLYEELIKRNLL